MSLEILTPKEMAEVDRLTIATGPLGGVDLMRRAGSAVAALILERHPAAARVHVLCGPGNNGGDGYVVASLLAETGVEVSVWSDVHPRDGSDASIVAAGWHGRLGPLADFHCKTGDLVVDALFGAGLARPLEGRAQAALKEARRVHGITVVAVDLPSGVSGLSGAALGDVCPANLTVTFFRKKPGHLLYPGRVLCGETVVADIGIRPQVLGKIRPSIFENGSAFWEGRLRGPAVDTHKYKRGHVAVFSGGPSSTGAARLAAMAAARAGAGAVTLLSPASALQINATHLTSIMLRRLDSDDELDSFVTERRSCTFVIGPGFGNGEALRRHVLRLLAMRQSAENDEKVFIGSEDTYLPVLGLVLDADVFSVFAETSGLFAAIAASQASVVMTPHEGEFSRLFPDLAADKTLSKLDRAVAAAKRARAVIVLKGPDTVIAAPDGRAAINSNGTPLLATAGSGDVLAGMIASLLAQGMPAFEAACAAVWMHAEAALTLGAGLIAEDLPGALPRVLQCLEAGRSAV